MFLVVVVVVFVVVYAFLSSGGDQDRRTRMGDKDGRRGCATRMSARNTSLLGAVSLGSASPELGAKYLQWWQGRQHVANVIERAIRPRISPQRKWGVAQAAPRWLVGWIMPMLVA